MGALEDEHIFGVRLRESANDGSDFSNPDADYRIVFLGEDGLLHARDSSGTVTGLGGTGLTDPMTTRGDIVIRNASNVTDRLGVGSSGDVLTSDGTDVAWAAPAGGGSSYTGVGSTERALVDPTGLSWSWTNQGSATITTYGASLGLHDPAGSSDSHRIRKKLVPSKPYTIYVHFNPAYIPKNTTAMSVGWFQSSDGHFTGLNQYWFNGTGMGVGKSATNYAFTADYITAVATVDYFKWVKLTDASGGNRTVSVSRDGHEWILVHSVATDDFITPTHVYFSCTANNGSTYDVAMTVDSWEEV